MLEKKINNPADILQQLTDIQDLPTLPAVFMHITQLMRDSQASIKEISCVVEADQSIAMKILRLINSSFYGLSRSVHSVQQAIVLLGSNTLKNIIITASVFEALGMKGKEAGLNREAFWQHSMGCGMIARCLDGKVNGGHEEEGFISGIIHDIGKVVLDQYFHEKLMAVVRKVQKEPLTFYQAEKDLLGITHAEIGARLAEIWCLPPNLVDVIAHHHAANFDGPHARLAALIQVSDMLVRKHNVGCGGDDLVPEADPRVWPVLDLDPIKLQEWDGDIQGEIVKGKELLNLMLS